jgi:hypothetical protein
MFLTLLQTNVNYRDRALAAGSAGRVQAGDRLPWMCQEDGTDNFASLRSLDWQAHVYGDASIEIEQACTQAGLSLRRFSWSEAAGKTGIARNAFYLVRPDGYVGFGRRERCRRHASRLPGTLRPRLRQGEAIAAGGRRDPLGPAMTGDLPARPAKAPRPQPLRAEKSAARRAAILNDAARRTRSV